MYRTMLVWYLGETDANIESLLDMFWQGFYSYVNKNEIHMSISVII